MARLADAEKSMVGATERLPGCEPPSPQAFALFLLSYVLILGPANYLILRRLDKTRLMWTTTPLIVLLFVVVAYATGNMLRGRIVLANALSVACVHAGESVAPARTYLTVFSPAKAQYNLSVGGDAWAQEAECSRRRHTYPLVVERGAGTRICDLTFRPWTLRTLKVCRSVPVPEEVEIKVEGGVLKTILNRSQKPLENCFVFDASGAVAIGAVPAGSARELNMKLRTGPLSQDWLKTQRTVLPSAQDRDKALGELRSCVRGVLLGSPKLGAWGLSRTDTPGLLCEWEYEPLGFTFENREVRTTHLMQWVFVLTEE